jgi:serine/threonine-protein kinase
MPPEQFTGAPIDGRADLFSLGVILYSLASGEQPFPGETMTAVSYKVVHTEPVPPAKLNPTIPAGLEAVILKCLAKNPANRYQTGEALAQDLAALRVNPNATALLATKPAAIDVNATLAAAPGSISHGPAQTHAPAQPSVSEAAKKPSKHSKHQIVYAIVLLVVAAGAGWFLLRLYHAEAARPQQQVTASTPQTAATAPLPLVQGTVLPAPKPAAPAKPSAAQPATAASKIPAPAAGSGPATAPPPELAAATPAANTDNAAAPATDPHKLDPNNNSKFKIELSHLPIGLPVTVIMNKAPYLSFVTGDATNLDNLYVPPGIQTFRVTVTSGSQKIVSNIVSSEFKAKKRKSLKIELRNQGNVPAGSPAPLSSDAQIFVSLSSPLF